MTSLFSRVRAAREGGIVNRCHTIKLHGQYTVAEHCYNALSLLLILHADPGPRLIKAVLWHDLGERWLGDLPSPAKWAFPDLAREYERSEHQVLLTAGFRIYLEPDEERWLKGVDMLELWLTATEQLLMGNSLIQRMKKNCEDWFHKNETIVPVPVMDVLHHYDFSRGGDTPWM